MLVEANKIAAETAFTVASSLCGDELVVIVMDGNLYEAMNVAEDVMLHYHNGDYPGMLQSQVLKDAFEENGIDAFVYEEA